MFWLRFDRHFGEERHAVMECRLRKDGSIQYYITYKRNLPGSDEDIFKLFEAEYEGYFDVYIKHHTEIEFNRMVERKKRELEAMQQTTDIHQKLEWLDMQECE